MGGDAIEVRSAGTWGRDGSTATREAVAAAAQLGIDIGFHSASRFTSELATWADLIITMTAEQSEEVRQESPDSRSKTFTFKELVAILRELPPVTGTTREALLQRIGEADRIRSDGYSAPLDLDVADPLGLSDVVYRAVANEIQGLVDEMLPALVGSGGNALANEG